MQQHVVVVAVFVAVADVVSAVVVVVVGTGIWTSFHLVSESLKKHKHSDIVQQYLSSH